MSQKKQIKKLKKYWVMNELLCDGVVLQIYLDYKFKWPQEDFKCESLAYKVVT